MSEDTGRDLVIIGGGPAGLTAGMYAARSRLDTLLLEKTAHGGQMLTTFHIENYPGFPEGIGGFDLSDTFRKQAERFGLPIRPGEVSALRQEGKGAFLLETTLGSLVTRSVIVASGASANKLGAPGEERLTGRGVSYCGTCDGPLYRGRPVAVIGGGDSAVEEALFLTRFASEVHIIHRRDAFRAIPLISERARSDPKVRIHWNTVVGEILGTEEVKGLRLRDTRSGKTSQLPVDGVFIYVGTSPNNGFLGGLLELDPQGFIRTDLRMQSSLPGVFAAGDVRSESIRQVSTAVGDGATAAFYAYRYLEGSEPIIWEPAP